jgi:hypothetical protein
VWTPAIENNAPATVSVAVGGTAADDPAPSTSPPTAKIAPWSYHGESTAIATRWLIKGILPETGTGLISGQWGTYKTTVALDLAVSVMTGISFAAGRFHVKRLGGVAYLALEGAGGLQSRLDAIAAARGSTGPLPFAWRSDIPALTGFDAAGKITPILDTAARHLRDTFNADLSLVLIDTMIAAAGYSKGGDESDAATAQKVMGVMAELSKRTSALIVGIDHFGKVTETGTRGSSAKEGHADVVLALLADRELSGTIFKTRLAVRKLRDGISGLELPFAPNTIPIGVDPDGDPITRVVIDWSPLPEQKSRKDGKWLGGQTITLLRRVLMGMIDEAGEDVRPFPDGPIVRACAFNLVRDEFRKQYSGEGRAERSAFHRAISRAQGDNYVVIRDLGNRKMVWPMSAASSLQEPQ